MAKIKVVGSAVVLESSMSIEDIKRAEKYRPGALELVDEKTGEPVFAVSADENSAGDASIYGVNFTEQTPESKKACVTFVTNFANGDDPRKVISEKFAIILLRLKTIENMVNQANESIADDMAMVESLITIE